MAVPCKSSFMVFVGPIFLETYKPMKTLFFFFFTWVSGSVQTRMLRYRILFCEKLGTPFSVLSPGSRLAATQLAGTAPVQVKRSRAYILFGFRETN
jgi:hypothetical protein